jgi:glycerophosphoryl diester phosphodiesterase
MRYLKVRDIAQLVLAPGLVAGVLFAMPNVQQQSATVPPDHCPVIISHAGAKKYAPENTVPALNAARDIVDADYVEFDAVYNRSNFMIAMHNTDVSITTTGTGQVGTLWLPDIQKLSAADYVPWNTNPAYAGFKADGTPKVRPAYTWEILNAGQTKNMTLVVDAKVVPTRAQADNFMSYVNRPEFAGMDAKIRWMANSPAGLTTMRNWYPNLEYWLIADPAANAVWDAEYVKSLGATTVSYVIGKINPGMVDYYHSAGVAVNTWTTNSAATDNPTGWQKAYAAGTDYLTTDDGIAARALCGPQTTAPTTKPPVSPSKPPMSPSTPPTTAAPMPEPTDSDAPPVVIG